MGRKTLKKWELAYSDLSIRLVIGLAGLGLPLLMFLGSALFNNWTFLGSISDYYNTIMRDFFVGILLTLSVVLVTYRGSEHRYEDLLTNIAAAFAFVVAVFPCRKTSVAGGFLAPTTSWVYRWIRDDQLVGHIHLTAAFLLLLTFAFLSWKVFPEADSRVKTLYKKAGTIYRILGAVILASVLGCGFFELFLLQGEKILGNFPIIFCLESIALLAFGMSWILRTYFLWRVVKK